MARKSRKVDYVNVGNKENLVTEAENQCEKVSHAALYARLSYESEKNRERNTIETQMVLLHNFVKEQKDIVVAKEYYDISKTGTNFERDGFNEMMQDIKEVHTGRAGQMANFLPVRWLMVMKKTRIILIS